MKTRTVSQKRKRPSRLVLSNIDTVGEKWSSHSKNPLFYIIHCYVVMSMLGWICVFDANIFPVRRHRCVCVHELLFGHLIAMMCVYLCVCRVEFVRWHRHLFILVCRRQAHILWCAAAHLFINELLSTNCCTQQNIILSLSLSFILIISAHSTSLSLVHFPAHIIKCEYVHLAQKCSGFSVSSWTGGRPWTFRLLLPGLVTTLQVNHWDFFCQKFTICRKRRAGGLIRTCSCAVNKTEELLKQVELKVG